MSSTTSISTLAGCALDSAFCSLAGSFYLETHAVDVAGKPDLSETSCISQDADVVDVSRIYFDTAALVAALCT